MPVVLERGTSVPTLHRAAVRVSGNGVISAVYGSSAQVADLTFFRMRARTSSGRLSSGNVTYPLFP